ncbi:hypothetical protein RND71_032607 [Anisodus tanguticus]|uniref:Uncharacterized protein n=1 Tax=Anisodus tanguticus TaxID=243964 RepID=A0AAE1UVE8_9SOLA|nr:hypothetical protein RND71_032607 [Anisodus tanguticus]
MVSNNCRDCAADKEKLPDELYFSLHPSTCTPKVTFVEDNGSPDRTPPLLHVAELQRTPPSTFSAPTSLARRRHHVIDADASHCIRQSPATSDGYCSEGQRAGRELGE